MFLKKEKKNSHQIEVKIMVIRKKVLLLPLGFYGSMKNVKSKSLSIHLDNLVLRMKRWFSD